MAESYFSKEEIEAKIKDTVDYEWIEGYKGTDANMVCRNYQFSLGEVHTMPDGASIEMCSSGFHLCERLTDVFRHYDICNGNRFFKVKALVQKKTFRLTRNGSMLDVAEADKRVAKTIIFERELTTDEIFKGTEAEHWTDEYKTLALDIGIRAAKNHMQLIRLTELGYSASFAVLMCEANLGDIAEAVGQQEGLSMDMKVFTIFEMENVRKRLRGGDFASLMKSRFNFPPIQPLSMSKGVIRG